MFGTGNERWVRLDRGNPPFSKTGKPWLGRTAGQIVNGQLLTTVRMSSDWAWAKVRIISRKEKRVREEMSAIFFVV